MSIARREIIDLASRRAKTIRPATPKGVYSTERLDAAANRIIPNVRVSIEGALPNGKDAMHQCLYRRERTERHFTDVRVTGFDREGLIGVCRFCGVAIKNLMDKIRPSEISFFYGHDVPPPDWID